MKVAACVLSVLFFVSLVVAQDKVAPAPAPAGGMQTAVAPGGPPPAMGQMDKRMCPAREGMAMGPNAMMPNAMGPGCCGMRGAGLRCGMGRMGGGGGPGAMRCGSCCFFLGHVLLALLILVNVLLTVIISQHMTRAGRFNGWWIPLLLIAGIPGSVIYALLRIGDGMQSKG